MNIIYKKNIGFTLIELLVVVAIIGILAAVGVVAYNGYTGSAKKAIAKQNHNTVIKWFSLKAVQCETEGRVTYTSWGNGSEKEKSCNYSNGWSLVMDLGYNHFRYHFMGEYNFKKNLTNPFEGGQAVQWNNGCSTKKGETTFYGYGNNTSDFIVYTNLGDECISKRINFPLN